MLINTASTRVLELSEADDSSEKICNDMLGIICTGTVSICRLLRSLIPDLATWGSKHTLSKIISHVQRIQCVYLVCWMENCHNCTTCFSTKWWTTTQHTAITGSLNNKSPQMSDLDSLIFSCIKYEVYVPPMPRTQNIIFKVRKTLSQLVLLKLLHLCTMHSWVFHSFVTLCTPH
jgi:hypothetical protein